MASTVPQEPPGLEPTYEGLKREMTNAPSLKTSGCLEPTYEGLKQGVYEYRLVTPQGLEPTYEGLKQPPAPLLATCRGRFGAYL